MAQMPRTVLLAVFAALLLVGASFHPASQPSNLPGIGVPVAEAGSNGQILSFSCGRNLDYGIVRGKNQNGKSVEWRGNASSNNITTWGWYWVGPVQVYWWSRVGNSWQSKSVNVPKSQSGPVYYANCGY